MITLRNCILPALCFKNQYRNYKNVYYFIHIYLYIYVYKGLLLYGSFECEYIGFLPKQQWTVKLCSKIGYPVLISVYGMAACKKDMHLLGILTAQFRAEWCGEYGDFIASWVTKWDQSD